MRAFLVENTSIEVALSKLVEYPKIQWFNDPTCFSQTRYLPISGSSRPSHCFGGAENDEVCHAEVTCNLQDTAVTVQKSVELLQLTAARLYQQKCGSLQGKICQSEGTIPSNSG